MRGGLADDFLGIGEGVLALFDFPQGVPVVDEFFERDGGSGDEQPNREGARRLKNVEQQRHGSGQDGFNGEMRDEFARGPVGCGQKNNVQESPEW